MSTDPFLGDPVTPAPAYSPRPLTVIAMPGQEVRIVVAGRGGGVPGWPSPDSSAASPSGSPDSSAASPSGSPDSSAASPSGSPDSSAASPSGSKDAFGAWEPGSMPPPAYSPRPMIIVAQPGQEVRILAAGESGAVAAPWMYPDSSAASPSGSPDSTWARPPGYAG